MVGKTGFAAVWVQSAPGTVISDGNVQSWQLGLLLRRLLLDMVVIMGMGNYYVYDCDSDLNVDYDCDYAYDCDWD